ncbi:hypothetical protein PTSG_12715 [Salpingoeca rosetta]|uniref:Choline/carnitine acyltransferase domain-containing protein n=1 Tax=Salpingoeca rosetta (strain ATCC 50818 / BSB-021) TaxID=946362 RepID=F2UJI3_SALR5|nr:uncharacterized protein PTSG_12715 [Salpingoeca rosetta]EGD77282.1 hypothetical protein PTSG_12715 [Salpingoeca rosetta]|eukprot:XP_004990626.1 hypothetical protein PTSG_12715 [Salpingoeca rosetta]
MAEARAMADSAVYRGKRHSYDYVIQHMRTPIWRAGDTPTEVVTNFANIVYAATKSRVRRIRRAIINALALRYKGFLYDPPKRPRFRTILWLFIVKVLEGFGRPLTYSFQRVLPPLPVPPLKETCRRYLESARPLLDEAEYDRMVRLADEFQRNEGRTFQLFLKLKSYWATNYVTDWWERFVYLRSRGSLMINSNYYIMDAYKWQPTHQQVARAANLIHYFVQHKRMLDREQLPPLQIQGVVPLCMSQYPRTFGTTRIPQRDEDVILHVPSKHITVLCKGHFYIVQIVGPKGEQLTPRDYEKCAHMCVCVCVCALSVRTRNDRYKDSMRSRTTISSHRTISVQGEQRNEINRFRAFFVTLDDSSPSMPSDQITEANEIALALIHGNGHSIWFDKSMTLIVFKNGRCGVNCEHTWGDAPVAAHAFESALAREFNGPGYDQSTGMNKAVPQRRVDLQPPLRLRFAFEPEAEPILRQCVEKVEGDIADLDLRVFVHDAYSKGFMKKCKVSPDAWLQMALQLAYYRDQGRFAQTYEASMTRLFRDGRTETVRPVTMESVAFARAMCDSSTSKEERIELLRKAASVHVQHFKDAMAGKGIDRHLFCLYVVSVWRGTKSPFLEEVLSEPWYLSTSQTPVQQTALFDLKNNLDKISAGGGFGPVTDDGYGVSYIVSSDGVVGFHVASKKSSDKTDSSRFVKNIVDAMADIRQLFL